MNLAIIMLSRVLIVLSSSNCIVQFNFYLKDLFKLIKKSMNCFRRLIKKRSKALTGEK